jgi:hypothetical protein
MRDDLPYFSHDNNAQDHPKMQALIAEYGFEGYGRFWALNERIAASGEAVIDISKKVNKMALARSLGLNEEGIDGFLAFLSDPEIDLVNISKSGMLTTDRTQEDYRITQEGREKSRDRMQKYRGKDVTPNNGDVTRNNGNLIEENGDVTPNNGDVTRNFARTKQENRIDKNRGEKNRENDDDRSANISSREENTPGDNSGPSGAVSSSFLDLIKKESQEAGFVIPDNLARHLAGSTDPPWLSGPNSYFRFVAEQLRDQYRKKPKTQAEMRNLYLSALWKGWESLRETYPAWRAQAEALDRERAAAHARDHPPEVCPGCGGAMADLKCPACGGMLKFQDQDLSWDFISPGDFDFARDFQEKIRRKEVPRGVAKPVLDF